MGVAVRGLDDMRRELRTADGDWPKALTKANRKVGQEVAAKSRQNARLAGGVWAKAAAAITGRGTRDAASIGVARTARAPMARPAFWGARARTGWFANPLKYGEFDSQHPAWVGNTWEAASRTEGPYVINYTLLEEVPAVLDVYGDEIEDLYGQAFPDR